MTIKLQFSEKAFDTTVISDTDAQKKDTTTSPVVNIISKIITTIGSNKIFLCLSGFYLFTLVHEFGHALSYRMLSGKSAVIHMSPKHCFGYVSYDEKDAPELSAIKSIWISFSGHLATVIFCSIIILSVFALTHYVTMPFALVITLRIVFAIPIILRILGEGFYAIVSAQNPGNGDFGNIRWDGGLLAVFCCAILLISLIALCIFGIVFLF